MVRRWSYPSWQKKSEIAFNNRQAPLQGCGFVNHSDGPVPLPVVKEWMEKQIEREPTFKQVYDRAHKRKGTDEFVDERSEKASQNYGVAFLEKYGDEPSDQPIMDAELWIPDSGGIRKGRVLGVNEKDPAAFVIKSGFSTGHSRCTGTSFGQEFSSVNEMQQVREEMQQKLDDSERRHKEEMEQMKRLYQEQMQTMNRPTKKKKKKSNESNYDEIGNYDGASSRDTRDAEMPQSRG